MLKVSPNGRFLQRDDGRPFFYLGDTAWQFFNRLGEEEAQLYCADRAAKSFTVIQAVAILGHVDASNVEGNQPYVGGDVGHPNEVFFCHVDALVSIVNRAGMCVGMLPVWGTAVDSPEVSDPLGFLSLRNARRFGAFLGSRYAAADLIWILGGDCFADSTREVWRALAFGLREGDGGRHLMTFHPVGHHHSSSWFHTDAWLDFNTVQTGHRAFRDNFRDIEMDYLLTPAKPTLDSEPGYEDIPNDFNVRDGYLTAYHCRNFAYWAVFAGACGHTYGCNEVYQFHRAGDAGAFHARMPWKEALQLPGSRHMGHLRRLIESRPFFTRIPDQGIVLRGQGFLDARLQATRDGTPGKNDATYLMIYYPRHLEPVIHTGLLRGPRIVMWWFNPRTGSCERVGERAKATSMTLSPPTRQYEDDWVLVLDDAAAGYPPPGSGTWHG